MRGSSNPGCSPQFRADGAVPVGTIGSAPARLEQNGGERRGPATGPGAGRPLAAVGSLVEELEVIVLVLVEVVAGTNRSKEGSCSRSPTSGSHRRTTARPGRRRPRNSRRSRRHAAPELGDARRMRDRAGEASSADDSANVTRRPRSGRGLGSAGTYPASYARCQSDTTSRPRPRATPIWAGSKVTNRIGMGSRSAAAKWIASVSRTGWSLDRAAARSRQRWSTGTT